MSLIIGFLQPYEQKFDNILMLYSVKIILKDVSFLKSLISVLKLHFQHLIFAKIKYNEFLSLIIGSLQAYEQKFVDILMLYSVKIFQRMFHS